MGKQSVDVLQAIRWVPCNEGTPHCIFAHRNDYVKWNVESGGAIELKDIAVQSVRRKGIGTALVTALKQYAREHKAPSVYAFVRASNAVARAFYTANGFVEHGTVPGFYGGHESDSSDPKFVDAVLVVWINPDIPVVT